MEMKAFDKYEKPDYITEEESRNKVVKFLMNCKNVGIGVVVMFLLCDKTVAVVPLEPTVMGGLEYNPNIGIVGIINILSIIQWLGSLISFVWLICIIVSSIKINKIQNELERNKRKKSRKIQLVCAILLFIIPTILNIIFELIAEQCNFYY